MANPNSPYNGQAQGMDYVITADGVAHLKAAGRTFSPSGAGDTSSTHLVEDATLLAGTGAQVVAAGPVRTKLLAASTPCKRITVKALVTNSNVLYVGLSNVTANNTNGTGGFQLEPNESFTFGIDDVSTVYIHGTAGEGASFAYEL